MLPLCCSPEVLRKHTVGVTQLDSLTLVFSANECDLKHFLKLQSPPVVSKMNKGDLKTEWS